MIVTVAPGTTPFDASVTTPLNSPNRSCASSGKPASSERMRNAITPKGNRQFVVPQRYIHTSSRTSCRRFHQEIDPARLLGSVNYNAFSGVAGIEILKYLGNRGRNKCWN